MTAKANAPVRRAVEWQPSPGTKHWCVCNDVEIQCLAAGVVTDRMMAQAHQLAATMDPDYDAQQVSKRKAG